MQYSRVDNKLVSPDSESGEERIRLGLLLILLIAASSQFLMDRGIYCWCD